MDCSGRCCIFVYKFSSLQTMKFTHFHVHSQYSILDGAASIPGLIEKAKADGQAALALTDHGNMFGIKLFYDTCRQKGIKPILGCEAYVARVSLYNKEKIRPINIFLISTFMIFGGLTHYYFFIYAFVLYLIYTVKCIKQKNYKNLMIYNIGIFISSVIYILIFPYAISHIFFGYRGVTVEVDIIKNIVGYCKKINKEFFNGLLPFIIILTGIIAIKPKKSDIKMNGEMVLLVTPILIYLLTIVLKAPYIETRYIIPIYSSMIIAIAYCLREFVRKRASCKHTLFIISIIFFTIIYSPFVKNTKIEYIYSQYNNIAEKIAEKNLPIIYVFNTKENRILDDLYLFTLVDKSIIIDVENYDKIEKTESNFILICNNGVNEEKIKSTINGKIEYVQRMNACNIYEVKMDV